MKRFLLELTQAEALVFFEWIARNDRAELFRFEDDAEQQVLWMLEGQLEKHLVEPMAPNYSDLLAAARVQVRGRP